MTPERYQAVLHLLRQGVSQSEVARLAGVSRQRIFQIKNAGKQPKKRTHKTAASGQLKWALNQ